MSTDKWGNPIFPTVETKKNGGMWPWTAHTYVVNSDGYNDLVLEIAWTRKGAVKRVHKEVKKHLELVSA